MGVNLKFYQNGTMNQQKCWWNAIVYFENVQVKTEKVSKIAPKNLGARQLIRACALFWSYTVINIGHDLTVRTKHKWKSFIWWG